jgi:arylsulfatase A-like enzyme
MALMSRLTHVIVVVAVVGAVIASLGRSEQASAAPNVLIIVTDDQRAADTMWVMPKTRRYFERGGVKYTNGFAVTPLCCPSRATILTGRYAHNTGVHSNGRPRNLDRTTLFPRLLQNAGYRTAMVGKFLNSWPLTTPPPYFHRFALTSAEVSYVDPTFNVNGAIKNVDGYSTSVVGRYAVRFLQHFESNDAAPWLLYVAPHAPHHPWVPAARYRDVPLPMWRGNPAVFEGDRSDKPPYVRRSDFFTVAGGRRVRDGQLRTLMSVDDMVGRIFGELGELGEARATLAFFLSDNGYLWADHHLGGDRGTAGQKRLPYTASVRVPFFARWPGHLSAGTRSARLTGTVDIAPTVLEAAGLSADPAKPPLDGRSLLDPDARGHLLLEYWQERASEWIPTWASIRTPMLQYIETYGEDETTVKFREYYNLARDPWQLRNLLHDGNPDNNPAVGALSKQLAEDRVCAGTGSGPTACP